MEAAAALDPSPWIHRTNARMAKAALIQLLMYLQCYPAKGHLHLKYLLGL
jgi:hypothetical protein